MFKLQVQDDDKDSEVWRDVKATDGRLLTFEKETDARARLEQLFPILVQMERYGAGAKRARVVSMYAKNPG